MINKYKWLEILMFLPPIIFLVTINIIVDCANNFHSEVSKQIVDSILKEQPIAATSGNGNEREIKKILIEKIPKSIDCIAVGPSLVMYIGEEAVNAKSFFNLGVSGADHYDIMGIFGLLELNNINYKKLILCIDFPLFSNTAYVRKATRHNYLMPFNNYMINILNGNNIDNKPSENYFSKFLNAPFFSISYFNECFKHLLKHKNLKRIKIVENNAKEQYYTKEASLFPLESKRNASEEKVLKAARDIKNKPEQFHEIFNGNIDKDCLNQFIQLIDFLQKQNIEIIFWYHPFSPALWDNTNWNQYPALKELDTWSRKLAKEKNITTIGSYNPHELDLSNLDFMDSRHLKRNAIAQHFKF